jgi:hypothetical protein
MAVIFNNKVVAGNMASSVNIWPHSHFQRLSTDNSTTASLTSATLSLRWHSFLSNAILVLQGQNKQRAS